MHETPQDCWVVGAHGERRRSHRALGLAEVQDAKTR
jgi:hypothetical protein